MSIFFAALITITVVFLIVGFVFFCVLLMEESLLLGMAVLFIGMVLGLSAYGYAEQYQKENKTVVEQKEIKQ